MFRSSSLLKVRENLTSNWIFEGRFTKKRLGLLQKWWHSYLRISELDVFFDFLCYYRNWIIIKVLLSKTETLPFERCYAFLTFYYDIHAHYVLGKIRNNPRTDCKGSNSRSNAVLQRINWSLQTKLERRLRYRIARLVQSVFGVVFLSNVNLYLLFNRISSLFDCCYWRIVKRIRQDTEFCTFTLTLWMCGNAGHLDLMLQHRQPLHHPAFLNLRQRRSVDLRHKS